MCSNGHTSNNHCIFFRRHHYIFSTAFEFLIIVCLLILPVKTTPPKFQQVPPSSIDGQLGRSLFFRCSATGSPKPVITWRKNGYDVTNGQLDMIINGGTLRIESLQRHHAGKYICEAHSAEGTKQHVTNVNILAPPEIVNKPLDSRTIEGRSAIFKCKAQGFPSQIQYDWIHNGLIVSSTDTRRRIQHDGSLVIRKVKVEDDGHVTCQASNGYGSPSRASAKLTVEFAARVIEMPEEIFGGVNRMVKLVCPTLAVPPINGIKWLKDQRILYPGQNDHYSTDENMSLIIYSSKLDDEGTFTCVPSNKLGTKNSGSTRLQIRDLPRFVERPLPRYEVLVGEFFSAPCSGSGEIPLTVSWRPVMFNGGTKLSYCVEHGKLSIDSLRKQHYGKWECVLSSQVGDVVASTLLVVKNTSPHEVKNFTVTSISTSSIRTSWIPGFNGGVKEVFVVWYKKHEGGNHTWKTIPSDNFDTSLVLNQLFPNTSYDVAVVPTNQYGSGPFSKVITVKTKDLVIKPSPITPLPSPVPTPNELTFSIDSDGFIELNWDVECCLNQLVGFLIEYRTLREATTTSNNELQDPLVKKKRQYRESRSFYRVKRQPVLSGQDWFLLDTTTSNATSYKIKPLQLYRDHVYEFRVIAATKRQYGNPSQAIVVSTQGFTAYPLLIEPVSTTTAVSLSNSAIVGAVIGALLVFFLLVVVAFIFARKRSLKKKKNLCQELNQNGDLPKARDEAQDLSNSNQELSSSFFNETSDQCTSMCVQDRDKLLQQSAHESLCDYGDEDSSNIDNLTLQQSPSRGAKVRFSSEVKCYSNSDDSVRIRRETAWRLINAQKTCHVKNRQIHNSGIELLPRRCASALPNFSTPCPVSLDDRSRLMSEESSGETVFAVIQENSMVFSKQKLYSSNKNIYKQNHFSHSSAGFKNNSSQSAFQPCLFPSLERRTLKSRSRVASPIQNHSNSNAKQLQSSLNSSKPSGIKSSVRDWDSTLTSDLNPILPLSTNKDGDTSFEIDCSTSEVEVRFINKQPLTKSPLKNQDSTSDEKRKVDSDQVESIKTAESVPFPKQYQLKMNKLSSPYKEKFSFKPRRFVESAEDTRQSSAPENDPLQDSSTSSTIISGTDNNANINLREPNFDRVKHTTLSENRKIKEDSTVKESVFDTSVSLVETSNFYHKQSESSSNVEDKFCKPLLVSLSDILESNDDCVLHTFGNSPQPHATSSLKRESSSFDYVNSQTFLDVHKSSKHLQDYQDSPSTSNQKQPIHTPQLSTPHSESECVKEKNLPCVVRKVGVKSLPVSPIKHPPINIHPRSSGTTETVVLDKSPLLSRDGVMSSSSYQGFSTSSPLRHSSSLPSYCEDQSSGYSTQLLTSPESTTNVEKSRKDTSSIEDNYEWDSKFEVESEILEALSNLDNLGSDPEILENLRATLQKYTEQDEIKNKKTTQNITDIKKNYPLSLKATPDFGSYTKKSIEKRCAELREEFLSFQQRKEEKFNLKH